MSGYRPTVRPGRGRERTRVIPPGNPWPALGKSVQVARGISPKSRWQKTLLALMRNLYHYGDTCTFRATSADCQV